MILLPSKPKGIQRASPIFSISSSIQIAVPLQQVVYNPLGPPHCPLPSAELIHPVPMLQAYGSASTDLPTFPCQCHPLPFSPLLWRETANTEQRGKETQQSVFLLQKWNSLLLKETGIMELAAVQNLPGLFINSSNFSEKAELCQAQGCPRKEGVVTTHIISFFPARVCCLPPRSAVGWSTRGAHGHTQTWHVPLPLSHLFATTSLALSLNAFHHW